MTKLLVALTAGAIAFAAMATAASATHLHSKTFVVVMNAANEVPHCAAATNASRGVAVFHVTDEATGTVRWRLIANNLPGTITAAHIHRAPRGVAGMVVQPLPPTGAQNGVIGTGTFTNPSLLAMLRATPENFYVNVHTNVCPAGVIRGQFGEHGPDIDDEDEDDSGRDD